VLGLYAGIRPDEIMRMSWADINLETQTARVDGKTRRRRIVPLQPVAVALLREHPTQEGPVAPSHSTIRRWKRGARALLGGHWPKDVLRHTAASYMLALHQDAPKVALCLGNSVQILLTHYHEPVTVKDSNLFWAANGHTKYDKSPLDTVALAVQGCSNGKINGANQSEGDSRIKTAANAGGETGATVIEPDRGDGLQRNHQS
jgi:hypothetical protein